MPNIIDQYHHSRSSVQDAVKTLRTNIQFASIDKEMKTIVMTSVLPAEGKSTTSLFLGIAMAEFGKRTLVVEADCRRPSLASYLNQRPPYTMMQVLSDGMGIEDAIVPTRQEGLFFLDCEVLANPVEVLSSRRYWEVIAQLMNDFDMIIFDTPPLSTCIEAAVLAAKADGTIIVTRVGKTDRDAAKASVEQLKKANAKVLGVTLTGVNSSNEYYYCYSNDSENGRVRKRKRHGVKGVEAD